MSFTLPIAIPPGETIKDSLEYAKMTQKELALRLDISEKHLISILSGNSPITAEMAIKLEKIIGGSAKFWMNSESSYQLTKLQLEEKNAFKKKEEIAKRFKCYSELVKYGFVKATRNISEKTEELLKFFKLPNFTNVFSLYPEVSYRNADESINKESLVSWLRCGDIFAEKLDLQKYDAKKLEVLIPQFKALTHCPEGFLSELQKMCAEVGVALVFVPYFKNTKVNGATRWIRKNQNPLIQLNAKGTLSDIFWFTFFHELGHVLKHRKSDRFIENGTIIDEKKEQEADSFALESLIPSIEFESFVQQNIQITLEKIAEKSKKWGVDPSIIRGRLAKRKIIKWNQFPEYKISLNNAFGTTN